MCGPEVSCTSPSHALIKESIHEIGSASSESIHEIGSASSESIHIHEIGSASSDSCEEIEVLAEKSRVATLLLGTLGLVCVFYSLKVVDYLEYPVLVCSLVFYVTNWGLSSNESNKWYKSGESL